jgi:hypothetical protein
MENIKIDPSIGNSIYTVMDEALTLSAKHGRNVEFDFNGVKCVINVHTDKELLYRDYCNSWLMDWKTVGPFCEAEYDKATLTEFTNRKAKQDADAAERGREADIKDKAERELFEGITDGVDLKVKDIETYLSGKAKNTDGYGACIYEYVEGWGKLMQVEIDKGNSLTDIAGKTSHMMGFLGITGFMYGAAVNVLSHNWEYGEQLRTWHNAKYNHTGKGTINPALLTISKKLPTQSL